MFSLVDFALKLSLYVLKGVTRAGSRLEDHSPNYTYMYKPVGVAVVRKLYPISGPIKLVDFRAQLTILNISARQISHNFFSFRLKVILVSFVLNDFFLITFRLNQGVLFKNFIGIDKFVFFMLKTLLD